MAHSQPSVTAGAADSTWRQGDVLMKLLSSVLYESRHQDVQARAHVEGLNSSSCCCIQAQLQRVTLRVRLIWKT